MPSRLTVFRFPERTEFTTAPCPEPGETVTRGQETWEVAKVTTEPDGVIAATLKPADSTERDSST